MKRMQCGLLVILLSPEQAKLCGKWMPIQDVAAAKAKQRKEKRCS